MRLYQLLLGAALILPALAAAQTKSLADLEKTAKDLQAQQNPFLANDARLQFQDDLFRLVESDSFKTPEEFLRAAAIVTTINATFEDNRMRYELTFAAVALGSADAAKRLAYTWDQFLLATGRHQHIGSIKGYPGIDDDTFAVDPTVAGVRNVTANPAKAKEDAKMLPPNKEIHDLVTADQKAREGDFSKFTAAQMKAMYGEDIARRKRLRAMLQNIKLMTAQDYADASLVMQHGSSFNDYSLAHELAICATVLDPEKGRQLVALTYDRMLESAGYHQRVGTQYHGNTLGPVDNNGFNDTIRKALGRKPLAEIPKKFGD